MKIEERKAEDEKEKEEEKEEGEMLISVAWFGYSVDNRWKQLYGFYKLN